MKSRKDEKFSKQPDDASRSAKSLREEKAAIRIQRHYRARKAYSRLDEGTHWGKSEKINQLKSDAKKINLDVFKKLSQENIKQLKKELGSLAKEEEKFISIIETSDCELTHYTDHFWDKIYKKEENNHLLSNFSLTKRKTEKSIDFKDSSGWDAECLSNDKFLFFRFELHHRQASKSSFGSEQLIFRGSSTPFFSHGWVSLYDMLVPWVPELVNPNTSQICRHEDRDEDTPTIHGKIRYIYPETKEKHEFDIYNTLFFGKDIMLGIALAAIRELRRIGGAYQQRCLSHLDVKSLDKTLSQLFRIEGKIPGAINLDTTPFTYTAPTFMLDAIEKKDIERVKQLLDQGMKKCINEPLTKNGNTILDEAYEKGNLTIVHYLESQGAKRTNPNSATTPSTQIILSLRERAINNAKDQTIKQTRKEEQEAANAIFADEEMCKHLLPAVRKVFTEEAFSSIDLYKSTLWEDIKIYLKNLHDFAKVNEDYQKNFVLVCRLFGSRSFKVNEEFKQHETKREVARNERRNSFEGCQTLFAGTGTRPFQAGFSGHAYKFAHFLKDHKANLTTPEWQSLICFFYAIYLKNYYHSFPEIDAAFLRASEDLKCSELNVTGENKHMQAANKPT